MDANERQFVVLLHTGYGETHYDLFLQLPGQEKLMAWHLAVGPEEWAKGDIKAKRMGDHRKMYMTYEGEVSGGRGEVRRVAEGTAKIVREMGERMLVRLTGAGVDCAMVLPM